MKNVRLNLILTSVKKTLDLNNNVHMSATNLLNEKNEVIGTRITFDFPSGTINEYLNKWSSWQNAYKYRKKGK